MIAAWAGVRGGVSLAVILVTLIGQGSTLPRLVRCARPNVDLSEEREERRAFATMRDAALRHLDELECKGDIVPYHAQQLRTWYQNRSHAPEAARELVNAERASLIDAHERGLFDNTVMRRAQAALDMEDLHLESTGSWQTRQPISFETADLTDL